jgi:hypothetical protein
MAFADVYIETLRCQSLSVRKQDGRSGLYGRERDPRGMGSKRREVVEKKRGQALTTNWQGLHLERIKTHAWHIIQCSAMTGQNLHRGLEWVVEDAKKRLFLY